VIPNKKCVSTTDGQVLQLGELADFVAPHLAVKDAPEAVHEVFTSAGGNGHSQQYTVVFGPPVLKLRFHLSKQRHPKKDQIDQGKSVHKLKLFLTSCTDYVLTRSRMNTHVSVSLG
jgi:hypothetical protein